MDGVPRLKLMLTQMQHGHSDAASGEPAAASFSHADYAAPEVGSRVQVRACAGCIYRIVMRWLWCVYTATPICWCSQMKAGCMPVRQPALVHVYLQRLLG